MGRHHPAGERGARPPHAGFRWRSTEISRIEGFSDAVFAFAVTLLVVSLEVPKTFGELRDAMREFFAFAIAFSLLVVIWYNQYKFFRRYGLQDAWTITLNAVLLFVVLFFVYPLKFLFSLLVRQMSGQPNEIILPGGIVEPIIQGAETGTLMVIYGCGYMAVFTVFALLYAHAYRLRLQLDLNALEAFDTRASMRENLINIAVGLLSVVIAIAGFQGSRSLSGFIYLLIGPALTLHGILTRRHRRPLEANAPKS